MAGGACRRRARAEPSKKMMRTLPWYFAPLRRSSNACCSANELW